MSRVKDTLTVIALLALAAVYLAAWGILGQLTSWFEVNPSHVIRLR